MLKNTFLFAVLMVMAGVANAADGYPEFRIGYQKGNFDTDNLFDQSQPVSLSGTSSGTVRSYSFQVDFNKWVGVLYRRTNGSGTSVDIVEQLGPGATAVASGATSLSGDTLAVEGRYPIYGWLDSFVRFNSASFSVSGSESDVFNLGLHASRSFNETYLSAGLRLKVSRHFGVEAEYEDFSDGLAPLGTIGVYFQF